MNRKSLEYRNELSQVLLNHYKHLTKKLINQYFSTSKNLRDVINIIHSDAAAKTISYTPLPKNLKVQNQELQNDFDTLENLTPEELLFSEAIQFFNLKSDYTTSELERAFKRALELREDTKKINKYYNLLKPDAFPDMVGSTEFKKTPMSNIHHLNKKFVQLLSDTEKYSKLINFIDDLSIKYYTRKRKDGLIFVHDIYASSYTIEHDIYGVIKVNQGIIVSAEILPFDLNEVGFDYLHLIQTASRKIDLGNYYELIMSENDLFSVSDLRVKEINKIIDLMNYYDDNSLIKLREHIEKNIQNK